jgi:hypothetical protein
MMKTYPIKISNSDPTTNMSTNFDSDVFNYESINGTMSYSSTIDAITTALGDPHFSTPKYTAQLPIDIISKISEWNRERSMIIANNYDLYANVDKRLFNNAQMNAIRNTRGRQETIAVLTVMKHVSAVDFVIQ